MKKILFIDRDGTIISEQADQQIGNARYEDASKSIAKARELAPSDPAIAAVEAKLRTARGS